MIDITYKMKSGYQIQEVADEKVLMVGTGGSNINLSRMIILNETAAALVEQLGGKAKSMDQLVEVLTTQYDVTPEQARTDVEQLLNQLDELRVLQD